jgi:hypothetical protein
MLHPSSNRAAARSAERRLTRRRSMGMALMVKAKNAAFHRRSKN